MPGEICDYFNARRIPYINTHSAAEMEEKTHVGDVIIVTFWNKNCYLNGAHTVAAIKKSNGYYAYNYYATDTKPRFFPTIESLTEGGYYAGIILQYN